MSAISFMRIPPTILIEGPIPLLPPREPEREMADGQTFYRACRATNTIHSEEQLTAFMAEHPDFDLNSGGRCGFTLMAVAINCNNLALGEALLQKDSSLVRKSRDLVAPYICLASRSIDWIQLFLKHGADVNLCHDKRGTALNLALQREVFETKLTMKQFLELLETESISDRVTVQDWLQQPKEFLLLCTSIKDAPDMDMQTAGSERLATLLMEYKQSTGESPAEVNARAQLSQFLTEQTHSKETLLFLVKPIAQYLEKTIATAKFLLLNGAIAYKEPCEAALVETKKFVSSLEDPHSSFIKSIQGLEAMLPNIAFAIREVSKDHATSFLRFKQSHVHCLKTSNFFTRLPNSIGQLIMEFTPLGQQQRQLLNQCNLTRPYSQTDSIHTKPTDPVNKEESNSAAI